jgi:cytochrome P450
VIALSDATEPKTTAGCLRHELQHEYDVYADETIQGRLDDIAERRGRCPVAFSPTGEFWLLTRYDDISGVMRQSGRSVSSESVFPDGRSFSDKKLIPLELDGSEHRQYRAILEPYFAPREVRKLSDQIRELANTLIDDFIEDGRCDFSEQFAAPYPGMTFFALMGWPWQHAAEMMEWVSIFLHGITGASNDEVDAARSDAQAEARAYVKRALQQRRLEPADDLTTKLLHAEVDGKPLTDDQLFDLILLLMVAGLDTVQSVLSQSMYYLARHPETWDAMHADEATLEAAIEELLRWSSPASPTRTITVDTMRIGDVDLPRGERLHFPLAAANRDPQYFEQPDSIVLDREVKPHLSFGLGAHRCMGSHLARLELRIAYAELRRRMPRFKLAETAVPTEHLGLTWTVENVDIEFPAGKRRPGER